METMSTFTLKPIGHMKSVFHFKNGTPRQSSLCQNARGILTIEKSVFNNPEHSLDGLQHYSHAWILFVFHKNNNAHKKAKVKPPRLDGQRVGVFSTRSPYRPNNIGLSLAKIDKIQGATIHFSGIDILDGTPVIDIKPYIPDYDRPTNHEPLPCELSSLASNYCAEKTHSVNNSTANPMAQTANTSPVSSINNHNQDRYVSQSVTEYVSYPAAESLDMKNESNSVEQGFYTLSAALDKAGETLKHGVKSKTVTRDSDDAIKEQESSTDSSDVLDTLGLDTISGDGTQSSGDKGGIQRDNSNDDDGNDDDDDLLNSLVGDVLCKAASDVLLSDNKLAEKDNSTTNNSNTVGSTNSSSKSGENSSSVMTEGSSVSREITGEKDFNSNRNLAVTAPWLSSPPVTKVHVIFSAESLDQLQSFHSSATDPRYRTELLLGPDDAKEAITSILHEEPRSVYRRQKCQNSVYFFAIDVLHVTCWFDGDAVTVLRVRPAADIPQLQGKHGS